MAPPPWLDPDPDPDLDLVEARLSVSAAAASLNMERTFIAVKPDGVQRGLCGEIIKRFEQRGFRLVAAKFMQVTMATAGPHPLAQNQFYLLTVRETDGRQWPVTSQHLSVDSIY